MNREHQYITIAELMIRLWSSGTRHHVLKTASVIPLYEHQVS